MGRSTDLGGVPGFDNYSCSITNSASGTRQHEGIMCVPEQSFGCSQTANINMQQSASGHKTRPIDITAKFPTFKAHIQVTSSGQMAFIVDVDVASNILSASE